MHAISSWLVAASLLGVAIPAPPRPIDADYALGTQGIKPFSAETEQMSLRDYWTFVHPRKPDLVITKVVLSPARPKVGDAIQATIYYKNIGGVTAKGFYLSLEKNPLSGSGVGLGGDFAKLAPGEEKKYSWGAIKATQAGEHILPFGIDPNREVDESNRHNNRRLVTVRVVVAAS